MSKRGRKKLFRISKPYGYYMEDVEKAVAKYNEVIESLMEALEKRDKAIKALKDENSSIKKELHRMQLEMSMLELPDMTHIQEQIILNEFKEQKLRASSQPTPEKIQKEDLDLPIIGSEGTEDEPIDVSSDGESLGFEIVE